MIDRRIFLQLAGGGATAGAAAFAAAPVVAAVPAAAPAPVYIGQGVASPFADLLRILGGRLAIATDGRLSLVTAPAAPDTAPTGDHPVLACEEVYASVEPTSLLLGGLPIGCRLGEFDVATWLMGAGGQALWDAAAARHGWKPLMIGEVGGERALVWSRRRLSTSSDFNGLRIAVRHVMHPALVGIGAQPVQSTGADMLAAFEAGEIDAFETDDPAVSLAAAHRLPPDVYWYADSLAGRSDVISLRFPLARWEQLSAADRAIFEAVATETAATLRAVHRAHHVPLLRQIGELRGARPGRFSGVQKLLGLKARETLAPALRDEPLFASAYASMTALLARWPGSGNTSAAPPSA